MSHMSPIPKMLYWHSCRFPCTSCQCVQKVLKLLQFVIVGPIQAALRDYNSTGITAIRSRVVYAHATSLKLPLDLTLNITFFEERTCASELCGLTFNVTCHNKR